jgi:hypothetical protein
MWPFRQNQLATIIIGAVGFLFFLALTVYSYRQGTRERGYFAGLVLILVASFNSLVRGLFFPNSSPDPAQIGGVFRLVNGLFAVLGAILLEREWRRQRKQPPPSR